MGKTLPQTRTRVMEHTNESINLQIRRETEARVFYYAEHPKLLQQRLAELEAEWDIERLLEANAAGITLFGLLMASRSRKWLILPFGVASFLLQHALQGWCPPIEIFRRIGIRTEKEINEERTALHVLRGDYDQVDVAAMEDSKQRALKALEVIDQMR
jgi:hypothetical protein